MNKKFPLASTILKPIQSFIIEGKTLCLYSHNSRPKDAAYSFYWQDETNPVQHAMTDYEVFNVLSQILKEINEKKEASNIQNIELA